MRTDYDNIYKEQRAKKALTSFTTAMLMIAIASAVWIAFERLQMSVAIFVSSALLFGVGIAMLVAARAK